MRKIIVFIVLVLLLFGGCRQANKGDGKKNSDLKIVDIETLEKKNPLPECMNTIKVVPLETTNENLMGGIVWMQVCEPYVFMLDQNKNFFAYQLDGKFVFKVEPEGRGPEEVGQVTNFYVDPNKKQVAIYDYMKQKMFHYDFQGKLIEVVNCASQLLTGASEINMLPDNRILLALDYTPGLKNSFATLQCDDYSLDEYFQSYPFAWKNLCSDGTRPKQTQNQDGTYVVSMLSDTVYKYHTDGFIPVWAFKSKLKPASYENIDVSQIKNYGEVLEQAYKQGDMSHGCLNILMTDSTGYMKYYYDQHTNHVFWNLHTGKGNISQAFGGYPNAFCDFNVLTTFSEYFVGYVFASRIDLAAIAKECTSEVSDLLRDVKEEDNPILVFYPMIVK